MLTNEQLVRALHERFDYTGDNNRDVVGDASFPMADAVEEVTVRFAYEYLVAYLVRDTYDPGAKGE